MSQTAIADPIAYERASAAITAVRGSSAATSPEARASRGPPNRPASTAVPAARKPAAIALGRRTENSLAPNSPIQTCRNA